MTQLISISRPQAPQGNVIFVHGLGGDCLTTWQHDNSRPYDAWPDWLASTLNTVAVYTLEYDASPTRWLGAAMPLQDRALNVLNELQAHGIGREPIAFIGHSLGGLVIKEILREASSKNEGSAWRRIHDQTKLNVFLATPHIGADKASLAIRLGPLMRASPALHGLRAHDAYLRSLDRWYRQHCRGWETLAYYETQATNITSLLERYFLKYFLKRIPIRAMVVDQGDADPKVEGCTPIPLDEDHYTICKPANMDTALCVNIAQGVRRMLQANTCERAALDSESKKSIARADEIKASERSALAHPCSFASAAKTSPWRQSIRQSNDKENDCPKVRFPPPGSPVGADTLGYVLRPADQLLATMAEHGQCTAIIKGGARVGKTSAVYRYIYLSSHRSKPCYIDLSSFRKCSYKTYNSFLRELAIYMHRSTKISFTDMPDSFDTYHFNDYLEDNILSIVGNLTIALDSVDHIMSCSYRDDFFSMLRCWHNNRAQPFSLWQNVDLIFTVSIEPSLLILSKDRSPFNIATPIHIDYFTQEECDNLNDIHGSSIPKPKIAALYQIFGGHPYLMSEAIYKIKHDMVKYDDVIMQYAEIEGPFGHHIRSLESKLREAELLTSAKKIISGDPSTGVYDFYRFHSLGIVRRVGSSFVPTCDFYKNVIMKM